MEMKISNVRDLKDMMISAMRYALGRHTYIVSMTIDFLKDNSFLIDARVKSVLINDLEWHFNDVKTGMVQFNSIDDNDWAMFYQWLLEFEPAETDVSIVSVWSNDDRNSGMGGVLTTASWPNPREIIYKDCVGISTDGRRY